MLNRYLRWVVNHPWQVLILSLLMVAVSGLGLTAFQTSNDPRSFFDANDSEYLRFELFEDTYGARDAVMVAIHPKDNDVFTARNLQLLEELTAKFWEMPNSVRVQSLTNFPHTTVSDDLLETDYLVRDAEQLKPAQIRRIRQIALDEPTLVDSLVSDSGHVAAVVATVLLDDERKLAPDSTYWARDVVAEFEARYPDVDFYLTGTVVFTEAMSQATTDGFKTTMPVGMLASIIALILLLRSVLGMIMTLLVVNASVLSAIGVSSALGIVFQPVSSYASVIIFTLGIADCIHILVSHQQQQSLGKSKADALLESLRINLQPVFLTSITTAIGFICLNSSESPPLRDLGNITAIGVMFAFVLSMSLLPALIMLLPGAKIATGESSAQGLMEGFAGFIIRRRTGLLVSTVAMMLLVTLFIPRNQINDVLHEYFDDTFDVRQASDFISANLTGFQRIDFSIPAEDQGGISEPEYLRAIEALNQWAEAQPEVSYASSYSDVIKRLNRNMNGNDEAFEKVPEDRMLASQYLLMYEMSLPYGLGLDNQITMDKDQTLFTIVLYRTSSAEVLAFAERAEAWLDEHFPGYMVVQPTGLDILFSTMGERNAKSMIMGTFIALVLISFMIMLALRSVRYGLLSLLPNLLPGAMAFGVWGLIDGNVNLSVSIVACITLGVVVDDTVHFLSKYVRAKREQQLSTEAAVRYAFRTVGVALVSTSIILVANFSVMVFSSFQPASSLGLLTAVTIFLALAVDFLFFAPLLLTMDARKANKLKNKENTDRDSMARQGVESPSG